MHHPDVMFRVRQGETYFPSKQYTAPPPSPTTPTPRPPPRLASIPKRPFKSPRVAPGFRSSTYTLLSILPPRRAGLDRETAFELRQVRAGLQIQHVHALVHAADVHPPAGDHRRGVDLAASGERPALAAILDVDRVDLVVAGPHDGDPLRH